MYVPDWPAFAAALPTLGDLVRRLPPDLRLPATRRRHRSTLERLERLIAISDQVRPPITAMAPGTSATGLPIEAFAGLAALQVHRS